MIDIISILEKALPVFIMLGLGMLCRKINLLSREGVNTLKSVAVNITLPAVMFSAFATAEYNAASISIPLVMFAACLLALQGCASTAESDEPAPSPTGGRMKAEVAWPEERLEKNEDGIPLLRVYVASEERVETMDLETYVEGVLAGEMKNNWPEEALKAQAILARTFVLKFVDEKKDGGLSIRSTRINVVPNASYRVSADVYGDASAQVLLAFQNKYGVTLSNASNTGTKEDGYWYTLRADGTAPADAAYAVVILATTMQSVGRVYFDNIQVEMTAAEGDGSGGSVSNALPTGGWKLQQTSHPRLYFPGEQLKDIKAFAAGIIYALLHFADLP